MEERCKKKKFKLVVVLLYLIIFNIFCIFNDMDNNVVIFCVYS